jgi:hypothetical protein
MKNAAFLFVALTASVLTIQFADWSFNQAQERKEDALAATCQQFFREHSHGYFVDSLPKGCTN